VQLRFSRADARVCERGAPDVFIRGEIVQVRLILRRVFNAAPPLFYIPPKQGEGGLRVITRLSLRVALGYHQVTRLRRA